MISVWWSQQKVNTERFKSRPRTQLTFQSIDFSMQITNEKKRGTREWNYYWKFTHSYRYIFCKLFWRVSRSSFHLFGSCIFSWHILYRPWFPLICAAVKRPINFYSKCREKREELAKYQCDTHTQWGLLFDDE